MTCAEVHDYLNERDELETGALDARVAAHVEACSDCRRSLLDLPVLETMVQALPREIQPERDLWPEIAASVISVEDDSRDAAPRNLAKQELAGTRHGRLIGFIGRQSVGPRSRQAAAVRWAAVAGTLAVAATVLLLFVVRNPETTQLTSWVVEPVADAPSSLARGAVSLGQRLETGLGEKVRVVGDLGEVEIGPESALSVKVSSTDQHVFSLERGSIHADILAPPRMFIVETKLATAIDLGCTYTLEVNEVGEGRLTVSAGWVALERDGREWIVPAGASARILSGVGPQVPVFDDAGAVFRSALEHVLNDPMDGEAFDLLLETARRFDSLTLWHLAFDVRPARRIGIFETIQRLGEMPASISSDAFVTLDGDAMDRLRVHLEEDVWLRPDLMFKDDVLLP